MRKRIALIITGSIIMHASMHTYIHTLVFAFYVAVLSV